jgi:hypothetical protein
MDRRARALELVTSALAEVEVELTTPRYRIDAGQLGTCRTTLRAYLADIEKGALPPKRDRAEGLGRMVLDSWPYDAPLGNLVLQAERAWRNV